MIESKSASLNTVLGLDLDSQFISPLVTFINAVFETKIQL